MELDKILGGFVLGNKLKRQNRRVKVFNLKSAKSALLVYEATHAYQEEKVRNLARFLKEEGIKVDSLGYYKKKNKKEVLPKDELGYVYFDKEHLNWYGFAKNPKLKAYQENEYHLLIDLNLENRFCLEVISSLSNAHFKVGIAGGYCNEICDLTIATEEKDIDYLIEQIKNYLNIINN